MTRTNYEHGRKLILSRLKNAQRLLAKTRPEQTRLQEKLAVRIGHERVELAKWEIIYQSEAEEPPITPMDTPFHEEAARQLNCVA